MIFRQKHHLWESKRLVKQIDDTEKNNISFGFIHLKLFEKVVKKSKFLFQAFCLFNFQTLITN